MTPAQLLQAWLEARLPAEAVEWLAESLRRVRSGGDRELYLRIGQVARRLGTADLALTQRELEQATLARPGWDPRDWSIDQAARVHLLLEAGEDGAAFEHRLEQLCVTADVAELVAFYRGLPLYPEPGRHVARCAEGVRSNMRAVFEAVALRNPYPAEQLDEGAWNQMVLKALFVGSELRPVYGLERRRNATLATMLLDYAHERWAASRPISPELWRCVGPFARGPVLGDLQRLLATGNAAERAAAVLALSESPDDGAVALLASVPGLAGAARAGRFDWNNLPPGD